MRNGHIKWGGVTRFDAVKTLTNVIIPIKYAQLRGGQKIDPWIQQDGMRCFGGVSIPC